MNVRQAEPPTTQMAELWPKHHGVWAGPPGAVVVDAWSYPIQTESLA
jgi:hypothetical protein